MWSYLTRFVESMLPFLFTLKISLICWRWLGSSNYILAFTFILKSPQICYWVCSSWWFSLFQEEIMQRNFSTIFTKVEQLIADEPPPNFDYFYNALAWWWTPFVFVFGYRMFTSSNFIVWRQMLNTYDCFSLQNYRLLNLNLWNELYYWSNSSKLRSTDLGRIFIYL